MNKNDKDYQKVGRLVFKSFPSLAESLLHEAKTKRREEILTDFNDIDLLISIFREYYNIDFPNNLSRFTKEEVTYIKTKFTALAVSCYDADMLSPLSKKMKNFLREEIAARINTNPCLISQYLDKIKIYMRVYNDFENDIFKLVSIVKLRLNERQSCNNSRIVTD